METPIKDADPLEGLQKIVREAFPPLDYERADLYRGADKVFDNIQELHRGNFFMLPSEAIIHILHSLDTQSLLLNLGAICHFFFKATQVSALYLNDYCLQETMPHAMPVDILVRKTKNTKDGVFKLANLHSVSELDLFNWFGQPCLEAVLSQTGSLPTTLQGQTEEHLEALYSLLKIALAATPEGAGDPGRMASIRPLLDEIPRPWEASFNLVRLRSLHRDQTQRLEALDRLLQLQHNPSERLPNAHYQPVDIIARDLLMAGYQVPVVNNICCVYKGRKDIGIQIIKWCVDHRWEFHHSHLLIGDAQYLNKPELAFLILLKLIDLPNTLSPQNFIGPKTRSFLFYATDERVKGPIQKFAKELYAHHWAALSPSHTHIKKDALRLFIQTGEHESFRSAFAELLSDPCMIQGYPNDELIEGLFTHGLEGEAQQLIQRILAEDSEHFLPSINDAESFIDYAIKIDRKTLMSKLKAALASPTSCLSYRGKLQLLLRLARHEKEAEEVYSVNQARLLYESWKSADAEEANDEEYDFATLYFYLNQKEECQAHYQRSIDWLLRQDEETRYETLDKLQKMGLDITSLEDMKSLDPFEIFRLNLQEEEKEKAKTP